MSVLIKGMEMPYDENDSIHILRDGTVVVYRTGSIDFYRAVPVPDHGRLGDLWVTQEENLAHAIRNGTNKTRISKLKMNEKYHDKFYQMTCLFPPTLFDDLDALSIKTGVSKSQMIREATQEYIKHRTEDKEGEE